MVSGEASGDVRGGTRQGERAPGIVVGCAELVTVESSRVDDAPAPSSTQTAARNLSRPLRLVLVRLLWRERLSCESVPCAEVLSCIVS